MAIPILSTKLYIPPSRPKRVSRPRLIEQLDEGLHRKMTLISASAGFGKTTLISEWVANCDRLIAWLSLDDGDNDLTYFLTYFVTALQTIAPDIGDGVLIALQSPQSPPVESILTTLLNEIATISDSFVLVLDDYHLIDSKSVDNALIFLLEHLPPQMHLVISTREDPQLPLARLRARDQLTELRAADLRFTPSETAGFLNEGMGLNLSEKDIAALETRTEGWIAGLQLAGISMKGHEDISSFIQSFTGSHHFVLDYLVEEVLQQQSESIQSFLLNTSILNRLCGSLCDAILLDPVVSGQETLEFIEQANLFLIPLDKERRWYRYHHLFANFLRQRLQQNSSLLSDNEGIDVAELHIRASQWYEDNGFELDAFHHATVANDVERAERLIEGDGIPLEFRGAGASILNWLESLSGTILDARPSLWVTYASTLFFVGQHTAVEEKLQAAERAIQKTGADDKPSDLIGRIASLRATLALLQHNIETIITQSRRALEYLHPDNLPIRTAATWTLGYAYQLQGDRVTASQTYRDVISMGKSSGDSIYTIATTISIGQIQEADNQLYLANETYKEVLQLAGDPPQPIACTAYLGLARIAYQWNDTDTAFEYGQQCFRLIQQMESIDTFASYGIFLSRLRLAGGDISGASDILDEAETFLHQHDFMFRMPDVASAQLRILLYQGNLTVAARLADKYEIPLSQARVHIAQGNPSEALLLLESLLQQAEGKNWVDEQLKVMLLQTIVYYEIGEKEEALQVLSNALALAKPGGIIRIFVDEGLAMARLLYEALSYEIEPEYVRRLLEAFPVSDSQQLPQAKLKRSNSEGLDSLSEREIEVLQLIAEGLSNQEVADRLYLSLYTVKVHARNIYSKLDVKNRTQAVAKGRSLGILSS